MGTIEAADRSINALNNTTLPNTVQSLIVRYAESPAEKAARLTRRERQQLVQRNGLSLPGQVMNGGMPGLEQAQLQQALASLGLNGLPLGVQPNGLAAAMSMPEALQMQHSAQGPVEMPSYTGTVQSSICVKGENKNLEGKKHRLMLKQTSPTLLTFNETFDVMQDFLAMLIVCGCTSISPSMEQSLVCASS